MDTGWKDWASLWATLWIMGTATMLPWAVHLVDDNPNAGIVSIIALAFAGGLAVSPAPMAIALWRRDERLGTVAAAAASSGL